MTGDPGEVSRDTKLSQPLPPVELPLKLGPRKTKEVEDGNRRPKGSTSKVLVSSLFRKRQQLEIINTLKKLLQ